MWTIVNIDTGKSRSGFESKEDAEEYVLTFYGSKGVISGYNDESHEVHFFLEKKAY